MKYNIQRFSDTFTIVILSDDEKIISDNILLNGRLRGVLVTSPALDGASTFSITIKDASDYVIYTKAGLAKSTVHNLFQDPDLTDFVLDRPLSGNHTITIEASQAQLTNMAFDVALLIDRG